MMMIRTIFLMTITLTATAKAQYSTTWQQYRGKPGSTGWRCHVVQPDPQDDGPDGINLHDWDGDGDLDLFSNAEQGGYSRLFFNPGSATVRECRNDFIEFKHGQCEDSGIGDLDNDGDTDYIANGGRVFFNSGKDLVRDSSRWMQMILFDYERRANLTFIQLNEQWT